MEKELRPVIKGWFGKLEQNNTIINRKFIHLDEGLDKVIVIAVEFSILFQTLTAQFLTLFPSYFPLSSLQSFKTIMKQQQTIMIVSFNEPTTSIYIRQDYSMGSSTAS